MSEFALPVAPYMSTSIVTVGPQDHLDLAEQKLIERRVSSLPVVGDDGRVEGMITRSDVIRVGRRYAGMRRDPSLLTLPHLRVERAMTRTLLSVSPGATVREAAQVMTTHRVHRVVVAEEGALRGIFSTRDLMRVIEAARVDTPIHAYMSRPVWTVRCAESVATATDRLDKARVSGLVVVEDAWPVGVFTQAEALRAHDMDPATPVEAAMSPRFLSLAADTRLHRAAAQAAALGARRVLAMHGPRLEGLLTGLDFAKAAL